LCAFALSLVPSFASADEPSLADWAQRRIEDGLVKPLADYESRSFSRSRPPPHERRVRVLQTTATLDRNGHPFVPFAIDVRFGADDWHEDDVVGCAYAGSGKLYVKRGDGFRPASFLLGKNADAVAGVCEAGPARS
jgi:hypothetical protein